VLGGYLIFQYQLVVGVSKILFQKVWTKVGGYLLVCLGIVKWFMVSST
jgi:hypothetical protein